MKSSARNTSSKSQNNFNIYESTTTNSLKFEKEQITEAPEFQFFGELTLITSGKGAISYSNSKKKGQKFYYGVSGSKLYQVKQLEGSGAEASLDIVFCLYQEFDHFQDDYDSCEGIFGFQLTKNRQTIKFIACSDEDRQQWKKSMACYVIQQDITHDYVLQRIIGTGGFGKVHLASPQYMEDEGAHQKVAIKVMSKEQISKRNNGIENLINEITVHQTMIQCENVLKLFSLYEDNKNVYMVLEYQKYGSLLDSISRKCNFSEIQIKSIMEQLLLALDFFHRKKIIHGDIKLDNILINQIHEGQYDVRVADFGIAKFLQDNQLCQAKCGTPGYVAPEILAKEGGFDFKADIFSLGVVFYNLLTGKTLFPGNNSLEILKKNAKCKLSHITQHLYSTSPSGKELLLKMLQKSPKIRPTAEEVLQHQWFKTDQKVIKNLLSVNELLCNNPDNLSSRSSENSLRSFSSFFDENANLFYKQEPKFNRTKKTDSSKAQFLNPLNAKSNHNSSLNNSSSSNENSQCNSFRVNYYAALNQSRSKSSFNRSAANLQQTQQNHPKMEKHKSAMPSHVNLQGGGNLIVIENLQGTPTMRNKHKSEMNVKRTIEEVKQEEDNHNTHQQSVKNQNKHGVDGHIEDDKDEESFIRHKEGNQQNELQEKIKSSIETFFFKISCQEPLDQPSLNETKPIALQKLMSNKNIPQTRRVFS